MEDRKHRQSARVCSCGLVSSDGKCKLVGTTERCGIKRIKCDCAEAAVVLQGERRLRATERLLYCLHNARAGIGLCAVGACRS